MTSDADLANRGILIAGAAAAAHRANHFAAFDQEESRRGSDQGRIERTGIDLAGKLPRVTL